MPIKIPAGVVTNFKFDPNRHDFLFDGTELKTGMRVLIEDKMIRRDTVHFKYELERAFEVNRWCRVGRVSFSTHPSYNEDGFSDGSYTLVEFEAIYDDGQVIKRRYNVSFAWYVEKPIGEYAQIVRDGMRQAFPDLVVA